MKRKVLFFLFLIFSLAFTPLFAQNNSEAEEAISLFEIDRLIRRTEYDEALRQLNIYIKVNPDKFDAAQSRIKRIMNARISYAQLAEKLILLIQTDPENDKEIYELTSRLEAFEKNPSDENLRFIADLKKSAEFNYFRAQFVTIQNEASALAQTEKYSEAVDKLKEGFWLYKDDFYEKWSEHPEIIKNVEDILADLDRSLKAYQDKNYLPKFYDAIQAFIKAVNQDAYDDAVSRFQDIKNRFSAYFILRTEVYNLAEALNNQFIELQKLDGDLSDASYLPFLYRFLTGLSSLRDSGVLGAMDRCWNSYISSMNDAVFAMVQKKYGDYESGITKAYCLEVKKYTDLEKNIIALYDISKGPEGQGINSSLEDYYVKADYLEKLSANAFKLANLCSDLDSLNLRIKEMISSLRDEDKADDAMIERMFTSIVDISNMLGIRSEQELTVVEWGKKYNQEGFSDWESLDLLYDKNLDYAFSQSAGILTSVWQEIASVFSQQAEGFVNTAQAYYSVVTSYQNGLDARLSADEISKINREISNAIASYNKKDELDLGIKYSYPSIALAFAQYAKKSINKNISDINGFSKDMKESFEAHRQWKDNQEIKEILDKSIVFFDKENTELKDLLAKMESLQTLAEKKLTAAQLARNEADVRFSEAENALQKNDFTLARKKLQDSLSKYNESLMNQDDEDFSAAVDKKLLALGDQIIKAENEVVVRDVRNLKNRAKDAYFNGRFDDAEKYLNEAKTRWAVTNVTEDEEIKSLLVFVQTALSMNTGRVILPSAPQYPEMSQLLNISNQYYDEGVAYLKKGDSTSAQEAFKSALTSIRKVQYVYPLNQQAAILTLKINREVDPQKFREEFSQKIEAARLMCQKADTRQEGYANLLDYYELEPAYSGLKDLIYQTEIEIGIRQKPVTKSGENSAKKLISQAESAYNKAGNDTAALKKALALVDQALTMLPNDKTAINLKDAITTKIGGNTLPVLSTEEERLYQLAVQRLQSNNVVGARALVNQILRKPQNENIQKIKDLIVKIEARS